MSEQPMIINDRDNDNGFGGGLGTGLYYFIEVISNLN